ncbi:hypothetical protein HDU76_002613, partial [Blyttiomyces sp. JEL0837]
ARSKKLASFFGDTPKLDITISEIERTGISALLASKIPLTYFLVSLLEDYCAENLFFYLESAFFSVSSRNLPPTTQLANASHIYETYLTPASFFEINIDHKVRSAVETSLRSRTDLPTCFEPAKLHVLGLLEGSYFKFRNSESYAKMKEEVGEFGGRVLSERLVALGVGLLRGYLNKQVVHPEGSLENRRAHLVRCMIEEFCKTVLETSLDETPEEQRDLNESNPSNPTAMPRPKGFFKKKSAQR